jgi:hypothetical protein
MDNKNAIVKQPNISADVYCETAMCAWECVLTSLGSKDAVDLFTRKIRESVGTVSLRLEDVRDTWSVGLSNAYENYVEKHPDAQDHGGAYDWEVVPEVIELAIQSGSPLYKQTTWDDAVEHYFSKCGYKANDCHSGDAAISFHHHGVELECVQ